MRNGGNARPAHPVALLPMSGTADMKRAGGAERRILAVLATTQVISWGSLYYAFSILAPHMKAELGWSDTLLHGAFSLSLVICGCLAAPVGGLLDRIGGRRVMALGSLLAALGLGLLSVARDLLPFLAAWAVLGAAMALTLYEAAFATITREFTTDVRRGISTLTLFGGLASTVFWPLTAAMAQAQGWRATCLGYAALHLLLCLPLHLALPAGPRPRIAGTSAAGASHTLDQALRHPAFWLLTLAFALNALIFSAMSAHIVRLIGHGNAPPQVVLMLISLIGPFQVLGRLGERWFADRIAAENVGRLVFLALPMAFAGLLTLQGITGAALFCLIYGLGNGVLTIVRGLVPQDLFGRAHYGAIAGAMAAPGLLARASGPLALAMCLAGSGSSQAALVALLGCSVAALAAYWAALQAATRHQRRNLASAVMADNSRFKN
jgi:nitrate/nitrite transporter NarK